MGATSPIGVAELFSTTIEHEATVQRSIGDECRLTPDYFLEAVKRLLTGRNHIVFTFSRSVITAGVDEESTHKAFGTMRGSTKRIIQCESPPGDYENEKFVWKVGNGGQPMRTRLRRSDLDLKMGDSLRLRSETSRMFFVTFTIDRSESGRIQ